MKNKQEMKKYFLLIGTGIYLFIINGIDGFAQKIDYIAPFEKSVFTSNERIILYAQPLTVVGIHSFLTFKKSIPGPFVKYTEELLGISSKIKEELEEWSIDSVGFSYHQEVDPNGIFLIKPGKNFNENDLLNFSNSRLIIYPLVNIQNNKQNVDQIKVNIEPWTPIAPIYPNLFQSFDTTFRILMKDSLLVRIPVVKPKNEIKTTYDKAKETANIIYRIRQRKFELILSEDDPIPANVEPLQYIIKELENLENEYLKLFVGHVITKKFVYVTYYTPNAKIQELQIELFRFSPLKGITDKNDFTAIPVCINIESEKKTRIFKDYNSPLTGFSKNCLYYKIPEYCNITVTLKNTILGNKRIPIYQYGTIIPHAILP